MLKETTSATQHGSYAFRMFDGIFYVDNPLNGELKDWPANIQDPIYKAVEELAATTEMRLAIVHSRCDIDYGITKDKDRWFLHVVVSEVVADPDRLIEREKALERHIRNSIEKGERVLH